MSRHARFIVPTILLLLLLTSAALAGTVTTIHAFDGTDGDLPYDRVISDSSGNLYGVTHGGGTLGFGVVFELIKNLDGTYSENVLYSFAGGVDGEEPSSALLRDSAGNLYGTTFAGGNVASDACMFGTFGYPGCGTVFKLSPNGGGTWTKSTIYIFQGGVDGSQPWASPLVQDSAGVLYGTTSAGGIACDSGFDCGTVFSLTPNTDGTYTESVLYRFAGLGSQDGVLPGPLTLDRRGNLYGMTVAGGIGCPSQGCGTVYRLNKNSGWSETVLYRFAGKKDGAFPHAKLVFDGPQRLYGSTSNGGDGKDQDCIIGSTPVGCGLVFQLTLSGSTAKKTTLHTFTGAPNDGKAPWTLVVDDQHNVYGTTQQGGNVGFGDGTIFKLTRSSNGSWTETLLFNFGLGLDGPPQDGVILDSSGNLFGTSLGGQLLCRGNSACGTVFEWTP